MITQCRFRHLHRLGHLRHCAPGLTVRQALEKCGAMQMLDVPSPRPTAGS